MQEGDRNEYKALSDPKIMQGSHLLQQFYLLQFKLIYGLSRKLGLIFYFPNIISTDILKKRLGSSAFNQINEWQIVLA